MAHSIDGITAENIKELASESNALSTILQQDGMDAQFLAKVLQSMETVSKEDPTTSEDNAFAMACFFSLICSVIASLSLRAESIPLY